MTEEWPNQVETIIRTNEGKPVFYRFWVENGRSQAGRERSSTVTFLG